jgi:ATP-binding protein involved in chromosome partitioning
MAAQQVAARAADFAQKSNLRILGVVENMTGFDCACGTRHAPFGAGGGEHLAQRLGVPLLAAIPLIDDVAQGGDSGTPVASTETTHGVFAQLATSVSEVSATLIPAGCTARLLDSLDQAVREVEAS